MLRIPPVEHELLVSFFLKKDFIYLFLERGEGKEKEKERNINVWLPLSCPLLGTWPATQSCALTGNRINDLLVCRPAISPLSHTSQGYVAFSFSFFKKNLLLFNYSCLHFLPIPPPEPTSLPRLHPPPWFCPCVLYSSSCKALSPLSPLHSPLAIVRLFLTSMSLVIFFLLFLLLLIVQLKVRSYGICPLPPGLFHLA